MDNDQMIHKHHSDIFKSWHMLALVIPSIIFVFVIAFFIKSSSSSKGQRVAAFNFIPTPIPRVAVNVGGTVVIAEKAQTPEDRAIGLSKYSTLGADEGMLFVMGNNVTASFWMKDMSFPIDIIWINDETVAQIHKNVEAEPDVTDTRLLKLYVPNDPVDYVLEVNSGFSDANGIEVGDPVTFNAL